MGRKLRVFVSSTMRDLANERDAVVRRLRQFNVEPVNAESFSPVGRIWERIHDEIESSDALLLILGERYGFVPESGPVAAARLSVTHAEYRAARQLGLPILAFLKELEYGLEPDEGRDAFRREIGDWSEGQIVSPFRLASDLADGVGAAIVALLTDHFLSTRVRARAQAALEKALAIEPAARAAAPAACPDLPQDLVEAVRAREAVLIAGAGISLEAGFPGASMYAESLTRRIRSFEPAYSLSPSEYTHGRVAEDLEEIAGRDELVRTVQQMLHPPQGVRPTRSHVSAVRFFPRIITSNFDTLFEEACSEEGDGRPVLTAPPDEPSLPDTAIIKVRGSVDRAPSMILTASDLESRRGRWASRWKALAAILRRHMTVVVGSTLGDPGLTEIITDAMPDVRGYFVMPSAHRITVRRFARWNLLPIPSHAEGFFWALSDASRA